MIQKTLHLVATGRSLYFAINCPLFIFKTSSRYVLIVKVCLVLFFPSLVTYSIAATLKESARRETCMGPLAWLFCV